MSNINQAIQLAAEIEVQDGSTVSKTLHQDDGLKIVLFGFAAGQELSEHTAAVPAIMHFLEGEADVTVGETKSAATANTFYHMEANMPHSITARQPTKMLLTLLKACKT